MGFSCLTSAGAEKVTNGLTSTTITTTGTIDNLDFSNADLIRMNNASLATIRGLQAGTDAQRVTIVSVGAGQVDFANQDSGSTAANRLINFATSCLTSLAAGSGAATYQYDATTARWRLVSHDQGAFISPAYDATNFTASAGTWTVDAGDVVTFAYYLTGRLLCVIFDLVTTSVSNAGVILRIAMPNGATSAVDQYGFQRAGDGGAATTAGLYRSLASASRIEVFATSAGAGWSIATNTTSVEGTAFLDIT